MEISNFLASIASNFRTHYLELARRTSQDIVSHSKSFEPELASSPVSEPVDSYVPSGAAPLDENNSSTDLGKTTVAGDNQPAQTGQNDPADETNNQIPIEQTPYGTYSYQRTATLDYKLDMKFDLRAFSMTAERLAEGDETAIESLAAASFGFSSSFKLKGTQNVVSNMTEGAVDENMRAMQKSRLKLRSLQQFAAQDSDFAMNAFTRQAADIRRSINVRAQDGHRVATNRIAMRFRIDNRFSFAQATRFNVQTQRIANETPDDLVSYVDSAGQIASVGSENMMGTFFDSVDAYLDKTEDSMMESVVAFFDAAAEELGFSGIMVDLAREHLTSTISNFFDNVETALSAVKSQFGFAESAVIEPVAEIEQPIPELIEPADIIQPELEIQKALLATA